MRLAIIGSRTFDDSGLLVAAIRRHFTFPDGGHNISLIVSGGAAGADSLGAQFARQMGIPLVEHLPDWQTYGKRAGFIRNRLIIEGCDEVLCFWDGVSRGTANSLSIAKRLKKPTVIVYF